MTVHELIRELERLGYDVIARKRTDGGYIITKINGQTFTGASGNAYARQVLGVNLSPARMAQTQFNVQKYIKLKEGQHKAKDKLDEEMVRQLRKVQRIWRKSNIKGKITKVKLRGYIREEGKEGAKRYLERTARYGQGYAYEENVEYLAKYIEDVAKGIKDREYKDLALQAADKVRSLKEVFREEWISKVYSYWYEVIESHYNNETIYKATMETLTLG